MPSMFALWRLKRKQARIQKRVFREINEAKRAKTPQFLDDFVAERTGRLKAIHHEIKDTRSSKILGPPTAGCAMKIPSSPRESAGCYEVRQVLGQSGKDLVFRADETVVRRGNDVNGAIDWSAGGWAFDPHPGESHFEH